MAQGIVKPVNPAGRGVDVGVSRNRPGCLKEQTQIVEAVRTQRGFPRPTCSTLAHDLLLGMQKAILPSFRFLGLVFG
jgi:hypothetical protein